MFLQKDIQMASRYMKKCSAALTVKGLAKLLHGTATSASSLIVKAPYTDLKMTSLLMQVHALDNSSRVTSNVSF